MNRKRIEYIQTIDRLGSYLHGFYSSFKVKYDIEQQLDKTRECMADLNLCSREDCDYLLKRLDPRCRIQTKKIMEKRKQKTPPIIKVWYRGRRPEWCPEYLWEDIKYYRRLVDKS